MEKVNHTVISKLKKITPYNVFVKWPRIYFGRLKEKLRHGPLRFLLFRNSPVILEDIYGIRFVLYPWDHVPLEKLLSRRNYRDEFEALQKLIPTGGTVGDIGANIGIHTTLFSRWVGEQGRVYAFEPVPTTFALLQETVGLNHCTNVRVYNRALSDTEGVASMNVFEQKYSVWNSFGSPNFSGIVPKNQVEVSVDTVDHFFESESILSMDFLKIDVEGYEEQVLRGASRVLGSHLVKHFSFEVSEIPLKGAGGSATGVFDLVSRYGYLVFTYNALTKKFEGPITNTDRFYDNYYASLEDLRLI
jgi:FkbM family methyltransferase